MGLFNFFKNGNKKNDEQNNSFNQQDEATKEMMQFAEDFVARHSAKFAGLDYSISSLEVVDLILDEASDFYENFSDEQKRSMFSTAGSYIFETARKNFGGKYFWYDHLSQPILVTGQPDFEVSILAFEKVKGRLGNGKEDNIPFYFAGYVERVKNKESGLII